MHSLNLPARAPSRLTASARPETGLHRWDLRVLTRADATQRLTFGSRIGGRDCAQGLDIPAQDADCRLEVRVRHATAWGWEDDWSTVIDETPSLLTIAYCDPRSSMPDKDDVLLSFAVGDAGQPT